MKKAQGPAALILVIVIILLVALSIAFTHLFKFKASNRSYFIHSTSKSLNDEQFFLALLDYKIKDADLRTHINQLIIERSEDENHLKLVNNHINSVINVFDKGPWRIEIFEGASSIVKLSSLVSPDLEIIMEKSIPFQFYDKKIYQIQFTLWGKLI